MRMGVKRKQPREQETVDVTRGTLSKLLSCFDPTVVPEELPCRDKEITVILNFIENNILSSTSGCIYISGVPGIGKTASVRLVIRELERRKRSLPDFIYVELNGMSVSDPRRIYVEFYKGLQKSKKRVFDVQKNRAGKRISPTAAMTKLERLFELSDQERPAVVLLIDEIDALVTKRQQHLYRILDWAAEDGAKLSVVAVANTLDLPERVLSHRNQSRLGINRLCFRSYSHTDIANILISRLRSNPDAVEPNAVELIARKVASVSSDIRRAFEVMREAIGNAISTSEGLHGCKNTRPKRKKPTLLCGRVTMEHVIPVFNKMAATVKVQAIRYASTQEKLILQAAIKECRRTGVEEMTFARIWHQYCDECNINKPDSLCMDQLLDVINRLKECGLFTQISSINDGWQDFTARYRFNVNPGDFDLANGAGFETVSA